MPMPQPRNESPDSIMPVFWMRMTGLLPPAAKPAAVEKAWPSRLTGTRSRVGSSRISTYRKLVSLSGSQTTCVTPFLFNSSRTRPGLSSAILVLLLIGKGTRQRECLSYPLD